MAMYYYASKISAIACGTRRCKNSVLQRTYSRGHQRDRDKFDDDDGDDGGGHHQQTQTSLMSGQIAAGGAAEDYLGDTENASTQKTTASSSMAMASSLALADGDGVRLRPPRRYSDQSDVNEIDFVFKNLEVSSTRITGQASSVGCEGGGISSVGSEIAQYDTTSAEQTFNGGYCNVNYESPVIGPGGIMYAKGRIVSGALDSLIEVLLSTSERTATDEEFIFSFLLSSRLFVRPHELLGRLVSSVLGAERLEALVTLLATWTTRFPYDYRDERMMDHVKHIVAKCSGTCLETVVSDILSALLNRLTDLERHEEDLRACQGSVDKLELNDVFDNATVAQYAQVLCRLEKKLAKHIGPEEFIQCNSNILLDKQKKWDQPLAAIGPPGVQDPKKTCNLETYLDWSARLRLFVCNEILQCNNIGGRSRTVELWSGVAQYCLLVGNYNSATAILETLESPPIARLKITWSKLQVTCQQLDCMQRHVEGCGDLWHKQAVTLNESQSQAKAEMTLDSPAATSDPTMGAETKPLLETDDVPQIKVKPIEDVPIVCSVNSRNTTKVPAMATKSRKSNEWVVIPVFADIVKLALKVREECYQRLPNGHINVTAFDRMAAIVSAFSKHMQSVKCEKGASASEYKMFCQHMQKISKLNESELMMASFNCEESNKAEKLMYDLN